MKKATIIWLLVFPLCCSCSKMWEDLDFDYGDDNNEYPFETEEDLEIWRERVAPIVEGCTTDYEKAQAIYEWECNNIEYDYSYSIYNADACWEQRKGVCAGYSRLFVKLAYGCDLKAEYIAGVAKKGEGDENHSWVKVNTEKGWILADPTWGVPSEYAKASWFDTAPEWVIFNHYPNNSSNQMLSSPITIEQFHSLPNMYNPIGWKFGWNNHEFIDYFLNHPGEPCPEFPYNCNQLIDRVRLIEAPYNGNLRTGETYTFKIQCIDTSLVIANYSYANWINNMDDWERDGDVYTKVFQPTSDWGNFNILARSRNQEEIVALLSYGIVE